MSRVITSILRINSVCRPKNIRLAIAAQIFVAAGVLILYIVNLIFAMRLVRSTHRTLGWHPVVSIAFRVLCLLVAFMLIAVIVATVQSFNTLNPSIRATDRAFQLYGSLFLAIIATLPLPVTILSLLIPYSPLDRFGVGRMRSKVIVLLISTTLLSLGAWYRCGTTWRTPVPRTQPLPGYLGKAPFYIFNFLVEIQTVLMYAILRVDLRWHIPNGAKGPGSYSKQPTQPDMEMQDSRPTSSNEDGKSVDSDGIVHKEMDLEKAHLQVSPSHSPRGSLLSDRLSGLFTKSSITLASEQKRNSEQARIIRRLGGPWERLASPTESTFSCHSPTKSTYSDITGIPSIMYPPSTFNRYTGAPSIPDVVNDGSWTPKIEWEFRSPRRFLSLKKRSMIGLQRSS